MQDKPEGRDLAKGKRVRLAKAACFTSSLDIHAQLPGKVQHLFAGR